MLERQACWNDASGVAANVTCKKICYTETVTPLPTGLVSITNNVISYNPTVEMEGGTYPFVLSINLERPAFVTPDELTIHTHGFSLVRRMSADGTRGFFPD